MQQFTLHNNRVPNTTLKKVKSYGFTITYLSPVGGVFYLKAMSNASMKEAQGRKTGQEGLLVFWRRAETLHEISWTSLFAGLVVRITITAERHAAADAVAKSPTLYIFWKKSPTHGQMSL